MLIVVDVVLRAEGWIGTWGTLIVCHGYLTKGLYIILTSHPDLRRIGRSDGKNPKAQLSYFVRSKYFRSLCILHM